jgi:predicted nucleic acid-binding protein
MKPRYYMDTSVFYGVFRADVKLPSMMLLDMALKGRIVILYSDIVKEELVRAERRVQNLFKFIPVEHKEKVAILPEIRRLARTYVDERVVGETSMNDCRHIAAATVHKADALVSWNFKHIVNVHRIKGYNDINVRFGYPILEIRSPEEVLEYETM